MSRFAEDRTRSATFYTPAGYTHWASALDLVDLSGRSWRSPPHLSALSVGEMSQYERTRPLSGGCREKTLNNHINVDALIQKGACNEARQVYGDGCSPGNDGSGGDRCRRQERVGNDRSDRGRAGPAGNLEDQSGGSRDTCGEGGGRGGGTPSSVGR